MKRTYRILRLVERLAGACADWFKEFGADMEEDKREADEHFHDAEILTETRDEQPKKGL